MSHHTYKKIEITGTSADSIENAINSALERASNSLKNLRWFEVVETRGAIEGGRVQEYQVTMKVGFTLNDSAD